MDTPDPKNTTAFKQWCAEQVLDLLRKNLGPSESDSGVGYDLIDAAHDLIEGHPELVQPMMDFPGFEIGWDDKELDGDEASPRVALNKIATRMAINMVKQFAGEDPEVRLIDRSRQAPHWSPAT